MKEDHSSFAARVICLYLDDPDTPNTPSTSDWDIARRLAERGIPFDTIQLAFRLAFIRRRSSPSRTPPPPIRSLAYFRAVALSLTKDEQEPAYAEYVHQLYQQIRATHPRSSTQNRGQTPESRGLS